MLEDYWFYWQPKLDSKAKTDIQNAHYVFNSIFDHYAENHHHPIDINDIRNQSFGSVGNIAQVQYLVG